MSTKKYTDWRTWWDGLRTNLIKCVGTTGSSWLGSNAIASAGIPGLGNIGLNWKQAIGLFAVHIGIEIFAYMKTNQPQVIIETVETTHVTRTAQGGVEAGSSKTVTTTPVQPTTPVDPAQTKTP